METEDHSIEEIEILAISDEILAKHPSKRFLIYSFHTLLCHFESHIDGIIKRFKTMTMTVLLAIGAAVGFSFSSGLQEFPINKLIMSGTIAIVGIIGIVAVWYIDIQVMHKFWGAFFVEAIKMEKKYPFLIETKSNPISLDTIRSQLLGESNFYIFLNLILFSISGVLFSMVSSKLHIKLTVFFIFILAGILVLKIMRKAATNLYFVLEKIIDSDSLSHK